MKAPVAALLLLAAVTTACGSDDPTEPAVDRSLVVQARNVTEIAPLVQTSVESSSSLSASSHGRGEPTSYTAGFYRFYLAQDADCSDPVLLSSNATIREFDLLTDPVLFTVTGDPGSYECIIMRLSDVYTFVPATTFGNCEAGTTYMVDTYRDGESDWLDVDGATIVGSGEDSLPVDNQVDVFFTTNPNAVQGRGYSPNQIVPLVSGPTIPGAATFVYDLRDAVIDRNGECRSAGGTYTFR